MKTAKKKKKKKKKNKTNKNEKKKKKKKLILVQILTSLVQIWFPNFSFRGSHLC